MSENESPQPPDFSASSLRDINALKEVMGFFREHYEFDRKVFKQYLWISSAAAGILIVVLGLLGYRSIDDVKKEMSSKAREAIEKQFEKPTIQATIEGVAREEMGRQIRQLAPDEIRRLMRTDPEIIKAMREEIRKQSLPLAAQEASIAISELRRPRKLSKDQAAKLRLELSKTPRSLEIASLAGDEERFEYAENIAALFREAGWKTRGPERTSFEKDHVGLLILQCGRPISKDDSELANIVKRIFDSAGIGIRIELTDTCVVGGPKFVVGAKP